MDLQELTQKTLDQLQSTTELAKAFLDKNRADRRYAVGKNAETMRVHQLVNLDGIIDDFSKNASDWNGIPLIQTQYVPKDAFIVNCSTSISPVAALNHLKTSGFKNIICLHELIIAADGKLPWPDFVQAQRKEIGEHLVVWQEIYDSLFDDISRQTLIDAIQFRLTADPKYMKSHSVRLAEQYWEDFMNYSDEVFVDAGGFDGDTAQAFADRYTDYRKILFFEPSAKNMAAARTRLATYENIAYYPIGLSNTAGILQFNQDAGSASSVSSSGGANIVVDTLDAAVQEPVSFIKMDLEGWEMNALAGARDHIQKSKPKLAIAVYHNSADFRLIYQFIKQFEHQYRIFLRHYTQGWSETIMFFTP